MRLVRPLRWGLVPYGAEEPSIGHKLNNERAEGEFDKPSFRQAARRPRCIHDRMQAILAEPDWAAWPSRDPQDSAALAPLLRPCPPEWMRGRCRAPSAAARPRASR